MNAKMMREIVSTLRAAGDVTPEDVVGAVKQAVQVRQVFGELQDIHERIQQLFLANSTDHEMITHVLAPCDTFAEDVSSAHANNTPEPSEDRIPYYLLTSERSTDDTDSFFEIRFIGNDVENVGEIAYFVQRCIQAGLIGVPDDPAKRRADLLKQLLDGITGEG